MTITLSETMQNHYGNGWTQRTGVGQGTDITPAINAHFATRDGRMVIDPGVWMMKTPLWSPYISGNQFEGEGGSQRAVIVYGPTSGAAFHFGAQSGGGIRGCSILLESGRGDSTAIPLLLQGNSAAQPDQSLFEDLYISSIDGSSYWWNGVMIDGGARASPYGARVISLRGIQVFNCRNLGMYINGGVFVRMDHVGIWTGKAGTWGNDMLIDGGTSDVYGDALVVSGTVRVGAGCTGRLTGRAGALWKADAGVNTTDLIA